MWNMKFGKLDKIEGIDFSMPPDPKATVKLFNSLAKREGQPSVFSGCTGWAMKEFVGNYYPSGTKSQDYLSAYAKQFNTIELNSTYYRIPDKKTIAKWVDQTPDNFRFAPKIPQIISQNRELSLSEHFIEAFCESVIRLGERLGTSFLQLPPNFSPGQINNLENFLKRFPINDIPLSVELRNENWFVSKDMEILCELLNEYGAGTVMSDVAGRRDALHMYLSNSTAMIRFVGNELHPSDFSRLDAWIDRLGIWFDQGLQTVYIFQHQEENLLAAEICAYFNKKVNEKLGISLSIPQKYDNLQLSLF
jgi:uncharacterized protein YecE (DUF72 family)